MLNGMQAGVGAVIASVVYDMGRGVLKEKDPLSMVIMAGAFMVVCVFEVNVIYVVIASGLIGRGADLDSGEEGESMIYLQLFISFLQIGMFSFGGGLCGHASDSGAGGDTASLAFHGGIYRPHHDLTDDAGTDRSEFSHLWSASRLPGFLGQPWQPWAASFHPVSS